MWIVLALLCALLTGTTDALSKRLLFRFDERVGAWLVIVSALPWFLIWLLLSGRVPLPVEFWRLMAIAIPLEVIAYLCCLRAIRTSPLSLCIPFLAVTPLLTVVTGWLFLGEALHWAGLLGVALVAVGIYVLQAGETAAGLLGPVRAMWRTPGIRLMLLTAVLFGFTVVIGKRMIAVSSPSAFTFFYFGVEAVILTPIALKSAGSWAVLSAQVRPQWRWVLLTGGCMAAAMFTHALGVIQAPAAYFVAIKRLSLLISVLYGGVVFREEKAAERTWGTILMIAGIALIALSGSSAR